MFNKKKTSEEEIKEKKIEFVYEIPEEEIIDIDIPEETINEWQKIVDNIAKIFDVPVALIMKVKPPKIEVLISSKTEGNPYHIGESKYLAGLYCNTVMIRNEKLLVPDALKDELWKDNPDVELAMISYLGYPITWPNCQMFGTICVLDSRENHYSEDFMEMLEGYKNKFEDYLEKTHLKHLFEEELIRKKELEEKLRDQSEELRLLNRIIDHTLTERIKELTGLYNVSKYLMDTEKPMKEAIKEIIDYIPPAWQYPDSTTARVIIGETAITSKGFVESKWKLSADIFYKKQKIGSLEVFYTKEKPEDDEGPFLKEELSLIEGLARTISGYITRVRNLEDIQESEKRYVLAQRAANIGSWDWNILSNELSWSERIEHLFGFKKGEFKRTYEAFLECIHPEDKQFVVDSVNASLELDRDYNIEHRIIWPNGITRWVSEKGEVYRDQKGNPIRMLGIVQDITERKKMEEELKESEKRFRRLFEDAAIGINLTDLEGRITASNKALQNMLGYNFDELNGMNFTEFTYQEDIKVDMKLFEEMIEGKRESYMLEKRYIKRNKEVIWVNITVTIICDEQKNPLYAISMVEDISVRKNAVMDLKESEEKNRQLINNANDAIFITSLNEEGELSFLISVNEKACALLGYTEEELLSLTPRDILSLDDIAVLDESMRVLLDGKGFVTERIFITKQGKGIPVEISSHLIDLRDQQVTMAIARDISERKQSETIQRMAYSQIERNIQELSNLVDGIRNPLAVIQGCIEVKYPGYDDVISKQVDMISSTTNEISDRWLESEQFRNILREQLII